MLFASEDLCFLGHQSSPQSLTGGVSVWVVDVAAKGQVVIGLHGLLGRRATGVVGTDPHEFQLGHGAVGRVVLESFVPDVEPELVRDAQVELWVVLNRVVDQVSGVGSARQPCCSCTTGFRRRTRKPLCRCRGRSTVAQWSTRSASGISNKELFTAVLLPLSAP